MDSLEYQRLLYDIPHPDFRRTLGELEELLKLGPLLERQLRALSLGERMRVGLAMALIYRPEVLVPRRTDHRARRHRGEPDPRVRRRLRAADAAPRCC